MIKKVAAEYGEIIPQVDTSELNLVIDSSNNKVEALMLIWTQYSDKVNSR